CCGASASRGEISRANGTAPSLTPSTDTARVSRAVSVGRGSARRSPRASLTSTRRRPAAGPRASLSRTGPSVLSRPASAGGARGAVGDGGRVDVPLPVLQAAAGHSTGEGGRVGGEGRILAEVPEVRRASAGGDERTAVRGEDDVAHTARVEAQTPGQ